MCGQRWWAAPRSIPMQKREVSWRRARGRCPASTPGQSKRAGSGSTQASSQLRGCPASKLAAALRECVLLLGECSSLGLYHTYLCHATWAFSKSRQSTCARSRQAKEARQLLLCAVEERGGEGGGVVWLCRGSQASCLHPRVPAKLLCRDCGVVNCRASRESSFAHYKETWFISNEETEGEAWTHFMVCFHWLPCSSFSFLIRCPPFTPFPFSIVFSHVSVEKMPLLLVNLQIYKCTLLFSVPYCLHVRLPCRNI